MQSIFEKRDLVVQFLQQRSSYQDRSRAKFVLSWPLLNIAFLSLAVGPFFTGCSTDKLPHTSVASRVEDRSTPNAPAEGPIPLPTNEDAGVLLSFAGNDPDSSGIFFALETLMANGFSPVVEDASIRRMIDTNKKSDWSPSVIDECVAEYSKWLQSGSIPAKGTPADSGRYLYSSPYVAREIPLVRSEEVVTLPHLRITCLLQSEAYQSPQGGKCTIKATKRIVELNCADRAVWAHTITPSFPYSWGTFNPLMVKPNEKADKDYRDFLLRLFPQVRQSH